MRVGIAEEVEHDEFAFRHLRKHIILRLAPLPKLYDPFRFAVGLEHRFADALVGRGHVDAARVGSFVEGVHAIVGRRAHHLREACVIFRRDFGKRLRVGVKNVRTQEAAPVSLVVGRIAFLGNVVRHHASVARQNRFHAQFALAGQNFLREGLLALIPPCRVLAAPALQIVHAPPSLETRSGDEGVGLVVGISQILREEFLPHHVETNDLQRHVDAVERHPVDFLLPALPSPGRHGIREGAIVEVVAVAHRCGVFLLLRRHGELHLREVGRQIVPGDVDVCIVVEIPVDARGQRRNV